MLHERVCKTVTKLHALGIFPVRSAYPLAQLSKEPGR